jgi:hypothetical protein
MLRGKGGLSELMVMNSNGNMDMIFFFFFCLQNFVSESVKD